MMRRPFSPPRRARSRGQAAVEYTIILTLVMAVLLTDTGDGEGSPLSDMVTALKSFYSAYSWAISFSTNITAL